MARVVAASHVTAHLKQAGWQPAVAPKGSLLFRKGESQVSVLLHPRRPDRVYLTDLLQRLPDGCGDLATVATDEPLEDIAGFQILVDVGDASDADVRSLLAALDSLNCVLGGGDLEFELARIASLEEVEPDEQQARVLRLRARPFLDESADRARTLAGWRATIAVLAERALPAVDRRRRAILQKLLDSAHAPAVNRSSPETAQALQALEAAETTITDAGGVLRYSPAPLIRELDPGPRVRSGRAAQRERAYRALKDASELPTLRSSVLRIMEAANGVILRGADQQALVDAVERDPAIAAKLIHRATRADVPITRKVKDQMTTALATRMLGAQKVRYIALGSELVTAYGRGPCPTFDYGLFWQECTARAAAARTIARASGRKEFSPDEASTAGLLCQIGRLAFATALPRKYAQLLEKAGGRLDLLVELEFGHFKVDHHEVAAEMMADWKMPDLKEAVLHQADPGILRERRELKLAEILHWTGSIWEIIRRGPAVERAVLETVRERALALGVPSASFPDAFDEIGKAWLEEAQPVKVKTTPVRPWQRIVERVS
jgi:HD-like signal output (HDOD) protein